jgi:hypothetical protein
MNISPKYLRLIKFTGLWTLLWTFLWNLLLFALTVSSKGILTYIQDDLVRVTTNNVRLSIFGSIIGYGLISFASRRITKQVILSIFWGIFWVTSLLLTPPDPPHSGTYSHFASSMAMLLFIPSLIVLSPAVALIAFLASRAPVLCPKGDYDKD